MWAQDAAAMYGYAAESASAGTLNPLKSPAPTTNPGGTGRPGRRGFDRRHPEPAQPAGLQPASGDARVGHPWRLVGRRDSVHRNGFLNDLFASGSNIGIYNDAVAAVGAGRTPPHGTEFRRS